MPDQVSDMGPLHKTSAFAGAGAFQIYEKNFNGTVIIANQIVTRLNLKSLNNQFLKKAEIDKIANIELRIFATNNLSNQIHFKLLMKFNALQETIFLLPHYRKKNKSYFC